MPINYTRRTSRWPGNLKQAYPSEYGGAREYGIRGAPPPNPSQAESRALRCWQCGAWFRDSAEISECWLCGSDNFKGRRLSI